MNYYEINFTINSEIDEYKDILITELNELGFESFVDTAQGFQAYIPENLYKDDLLNDLASDFESLGSHSFETKLIQDQNWNANWESNFHPIEIGNGCYVRAPFHEAKEGFQYEIIIEPKMSFGTGHHETTSLMMEQILENDFQNQRVLDMGCGTGLLGIFAKMKGATSVDAIDIDEWAYNNTVENIEKNEQENINVFMGGAELLTNQEYDIILANINRNILLSDMEKYVSVLKNGGTIYFSGIYTHDMPILKETAAKNQLNFVSFKEKNNWVSMKFTKSA